MMAIKAQALPDFIAKFTHMEEYTPNSEVGITKENAKEREVGRMLATRQDEKPNQHG